MANNSGTTIKNGDFGRKDNWNIRESMDNLDLGDDFKPDNTGFGGDRPDPNATIGIGNITMGANPQVIGGGGVGDMTVDPNSTVDALLGEMNKPKNQLAQPKPVASKPIAADNGPIVSIYEQ